MEDNYFTVLWWFCYTLTWISHRCTCVPPSWTSLPPLSPPHSFGLSPSTGFECPASPIELALVIYFIYGNKHVSMLLSQIVQPCLLPIVQKSVLYICVSFATLHIGCHYCLSKFHIYVLICYIGASLSNLLHFVW